MINAENGAFAKPEVFSTTYTIRADAPPHG
jgi:hypothetical protein